MRVISLPQTFDFVVLQPPESCCGVGEYANLSIDLNTSLLSASVLLTSGDSYKTNSKIVVYSYNEIDLKLYFDTSNKMLDFGLKALNSS